jgi:hypothetical protein
MFLFYLKNHKNIVITALILIFLFSIAYTSYAFAAVATNSIDQQSHLATYMIIYAPIIVFVFGGFGGILGFFKDFSIEPDDPSSDEPKQKCHLSYLGMEIDQKESNIYMRQQAILGMGGACAGFVALLSTKTFTSTPEDIEFLILMMVSVISGYGGSKLLAIAYNTLEKNIKRQQAELDKVKSQVNKVEEKTDQGNVITRATASLGDKSTISDKKESLKQLCSILKIDPTNRKIAILAGRIARANGDFEKGIKILTHFTEALMNQGLNSDLSIKNYADGLYNRSCYRCLLGGKFEGDKKEEILQQAMLDLNNSCKLRHENVVDAFDDSDFGVLADRKDFNELIIGNYGNKS